VTEASASRANPVRWAGRPRPDTAACERRSRERHVKPAGLDCSFIFEIESFSRNIPRNTMAVSGFAEPIHRISLLHADGKNFCKETLREAQTQQQQPSCAQSCFALEKHIPVQIWMTPSPPRYRIPGDRLNKCFPPGNRGNRICFLG